MQSEAQELDRRMGMAAVLGVAGLIVLMATVVSALLGPSIMPADDPTAIADSPAWLRPTGLTLGAVASVGLLWGAWRRLTSKAP